MKNQSMQFGLGCWFSRLLVLVYLAVAAHATAATEDAAVPVWSVPIDGPMNLAPIVSDGRVFVVPQGGVLQAVDAHTGRLIWRRERADVWDRGLSMQRGLLVACLRSGDVAVIDPVSGRERWRYSLQGSQCQRPAALMGRTLLISTTFVGPGMQAQPHRRAKLFALNIDNGQERWMFESDTYLLQTAVAQGDRVYVGGAFLDPTYLAEEGGSAYYYALDGRSGAQMWRHLSRDGLPKTLIASESVMAYVGYEDFVRGLSSETGDAVWVRDTENWVSGMSEDAQVLYLGSANRAIHAWDLNSGTTRWRYNMPGASFDYLLVRPKVQGQVLWFTTQTGRVFALSTATGKPLWQTTTQRVSRIDAAFAMGMVFIADIEGQLSAFRLPERLWHP